SWAPLLDRPGLAAAMSECQFFRGEPRVCFKILRQRSVDNIIWKIWSRCFLIPSAAVAQVLKIIACELLIETFLITPRRVLIRRPEARAVGREHFINQDGRAV